MQCEASPPPTAAAVDPAPWHASDLLDGFGLYLAQGFGCSGVTALAANPSSVEPQGPGSESLSGPTMIVRCDLGSVDRSDVEHLLRSLRSAMDREPAAIVTCDPAGEGLDRRGEPAEFGRLLAQQGLNVGIVGWARSRPGDRESGAAVAILERNDNPPRGAAPPDFRVAAIMPVFNEEHVIVHTLDFLVEQGTAVYLIDNWSTDRTVELARAFLDRGLIGIERFPEGGSSGTYDLRRLLTRVEQLAPPLAADWCMLCDADERRRSPWRGVSLRDGLAYTDRCGYTCVDHITANSWPTDDRYDPSADVEQQLRFFELSDHAGQCHQRKAWKNVGPVSLAPTAGHDVAFPGRLVYPHRFLLKHYAIRSQAHGERKVLGERKARFNAEERSFGGGSQLPARSGGADLCGRRNTLRTTSD